MIKALHHIGLSVVNLDRSIAFYCQLLATDVVGQVTFSGPQYESIFQLEGAKGQDSLVTAPSIRLELLEFTHPTPKSRDPSSRLRWGIVSFGTPVDNISDAYGFDPDGNLFELLDAHDRSKRICISVVDVSRSTAFYRDLLRMTLVREVGDFEGDRYDRLFGISGAHGKSALLQSADLQIELLECSEPSLEPADPRRPVCDHGITLFCVEVDDIQGHYERLTAAGVFFHCPPLEFFGIAKATYGRDPDGNVFELLERTHR